jgi:arylsulfatase A-like enzyme
MRHSPKGIARYLTLGVTQGLAAWSAYALIEFLASSVVFRLGRPYARFSAWHWEMTGQLVLAYMAAGIALGALAGLILFLFRNAQRLSGRPTPLVMEHAAALSLTLAIAIHLATQPASPAVWWKLIFLPLALIAALLLSIRSQVWSTRFGLLTNPWVVAGLFLNAGQASALQFMGVAQQLGIPIRPWYYILAGIQAIAAGAAVWLGRRWRQDWNPGRIFAPNWAAAGLAAVLMVASFALGVEPSSPVTPDVRIAGASAHPNVILIVMDTVRADHVSAYGYNRNTTPNLKKLAADATVYPQAVSAADASLTSHASIFTSLYASWHGAYCQPPDASYGRPVGPVPTIAEVLARNGYHTLGTGANLFLRADFGLQRGFQQFRIPRPVPILATESWYMLRNGMRRVIGLFADTAQFDRLYGRGDAINREFFTMLRQPNLAQAPFFAFFNYMDAHFPYTPPHPFDHLFPGKVFGATQADLTAVQHRVDDQGETLPPLYSSHAVSQYDGGIAYIDSQIGQLVDWLKRENLYDNTMIVVTADHGEALGERRLFLHGNSLYANLLHVGLTVKYPHNAPTGVVNTPVSLIDIFPTVMKSAGVEPPRGLQGLDLLDPAVSEPRHLFSESFPCPVTHQPECPGGCLMRAVVTWPNKYIYSDNGKSEVYELQQDPHENHNLFGSLGSLNPAARTLATQLNSWVKTMPVQHDRMPHAAPAAGSAFQGLRQSPETAAAPRAAVLPGKKPSPPFSLRKLSPFTLPAAPSAAGESGQ